MNKNNSSEQGRPVVYRRAVIKHDGNGRLFAQARISAGFTQDKLANLLGIEEVSTIRNIESGIYDIEDRTYTLFALLTDTHPLYTLISKNTGGALGLVAPNGDEIRRIRKTKGGLTQRGMASVMGLSGHAMISKYESDSRSPSPSNWALFLLVIGEHPHYEIKPKNIGSE